MILIVLRIEIPNLSMTIVSLMTILLYVEPIKSAIAIYFQWIVR